MFKKYAGIGSRETPEEIIYKMFGIAQTLGYQGQYLLRSGGAGGADTAFERGAQSIGGLMQIFHLGQARREWFEHAAKYHPAWNRCSIFAKALHARNSPIVLGPELNDPVSFVVCYTKDGKPSGGTGQSLRIANDYGIPIFNLWNIEEIAKLETFTGMRF